MSTMSPSDLRARLAGVVGFPVTPFTDRLALDLEGLRANVAAMTAHPFCVIVAAGGTGELYSLNSDEHAAAIRTSVEATAGRMPVIAGVGGNIGVAIEQATRAWKAGADGILALPPYYPHADEAGLLAYYAAIGAATPLGLLVYSRDWVNPGPGFVQKLAEIPTAVAWKDGQGDARRYQIIMNAVGDRLHWVGGAGDDLVGTYYRLGIRCYTSSISNVSPKLSLLLHDLAAAGDEQKLQELMRELVVPLYAFRARRKGFEVSVMKAMMEIQGQPAGGVRPPLANVSPAEVDELRGMMARWAPWL
jgi:5-dehydro-4-deoxyglucarate dehydratase